MLIRFKPNVSLGDINIFTERCEKLGVQYKFIQELSTSWLVVESAEGSKLEELYHQFRHIKVVERITRPSDPDDPLRDLPPVKLKAANRWIGRGNRPVVVAGSPYLESQKHSVSLANELSGIGANVYLGGCYRPTETLDPKALYARTGTIISDVERKSGIPSTGTVEVPGPRNAINQLQPCAYIVPGQHIFNTELLVSLAKIGTPILLERHVDASTELWLEAASVVISEGYHEVGLIETGRIIEGRGSLDLAELARLIENCPLPIMVHASRMAESFENVRSLACGALAAGASGAVINVHPDQLEGLLTEGYCVSVEQFRDIYESMKQLLA